jgi:hypothetical protein
MSRLRRPKASSLRKVVRLRPSKAREEGVETGEEGED